MKLIAIFLLVPGLFLASCKKMKVEAPEFEITTEKTTYKINEKVKFLFSGETDHIAFYSGEPGFSYDNRNRMSSNGKPTLDFTSFIQNTGETGTLRLLYSVDFSGNYDAPGISQATWTDITSRAALSSGVDRWPSGVVDLTDISALGKPVYFAFKYVGYNHATLRQPTWTIRTFNLNNILTDGKTVPLATIDNVGWKSVDVKNSTVSWIIPLLTGLISINGTGAGSVNEDNEDWVVSRAFDLKKATPDVPVSIQGLTSAVLTNYEYAFTKPGNYTVTFVAFNRNASAEISIVKQINITVTQ
ncbi:DUF5017 domain-containing protein [Pedobacter sp. MC2016-14]|uniref:DUF5017 domain-containing protein n=1 Tax=Pedobacter sp. MC2016-14 TaxID=2897327 RepID=UPI001E4574A6|nr:DUF5017 domain-containing protein [Pedobacter sp. MC2016-14]MCD0488967.1 DUF5017 domain-containing protein [Pedobacter sp. MC2016-14]